MIYLEAGALVLGVAVVALIYLMDRPEDLGRMPHHWVRRQRREE